MTPDPIPHARESAVEVLADRLVAAIAVHGFENDEGAAKILAKQRDGIIRLLSAALVTSSGDEVAELRALLSSAKATIALLMDRATAAEAQRDTLQAEVEWHKTQHAAQAESYDEQHDALQAENARLREALEPFARALTGWWDARSWPDEQKVAVPIAVSIGDLRRARAALTSHQQGNGARQSPAQDGEGSSRG